MRFLLRSIVLVWLGLSIGCAGSKEAEEGRDVQQDPQDRISADRVANLTLAETADRVRTVQLYLGREESRLPILRLKSGEQISLEFDLMEAQGRPLSVYFYHADRTWRRDLTPGEYMARFQQDELLQYTVARATSVPYVHYAYQFPNRSIDFLISGNYVLRVTEQGQENEVLFERPFLVTEEATSVEFALDNVMVPGAGYPYVQPIAQFRPPSTFQDNIYDYNVCFVRNGRFENARCSSQPSLAGQPDLQFYLQPEQSFAPDPADYFLDLSSLRAGPQITNTDFSVTPFRVVLEPDYARFPGNPIAPMLSGQTVVAGAVRDVMEPAVAGEYAQVRFSFVPPEEQPLGGEVTVVGSFSNWAYDPALALSWVPENGRYEGDLLLKQGQYEYRYISRDQRLARALQNTMPRAENLYTALVYYADLRLSTDRLLAVRQVVTQ